MCHLSPCTLPGTAVPGVEGAEGLVGPERWGHGRRWVVVGGDTDMNRVTE